MDYDRARGALADAIWWIKGFCAARPPSIDESDGSHLGLRDELTKVRMWHERLAEERIQDPSRPVRAFVHPEGRRDGGLLVITFAELERISDAVNHGLGAALQVENELDRISLPKDYDSPIGDLTDGKATLDIIFADYERDTNDSIPF